ncbi:YhzD family protein [Mammaliicoccus sciuri]|uniref:YhzD family protein n=1 Tax=Sporosarcina sp. FSL W7-1283 TaxID=2921560 RepID=UPI0030F91A14
MKTYKLTAYEKNGTLITEESFTAENDEAAKEQGRQLLTEKDLSERTHRLASPRGKLLLFHV